MKKVYSFRLSDETIKKLDKIVQYENNVLERRGIIALEYSRLNIIELLIDIAFNLNKEGKSIQYLKNGKGDEEKC